MVLLKYFADIVEKLNNLGGHKLQKEDPQGHSFKTTLDKIKLM